MVSGFHWAQHHSASLLLHPSFIHSLTHSLSLLAFVSLSLVASRAQLSVYTHTPFVPFIFPPAASCAPLCSFFSSHPLLFHPSAPPTPLRFISRSLCRRLAQSIHPSPSRCRTTSVGLDRIFQAHMDSTDGQKKKIVCNFKCTYGVLLRGKKKKRSLKCLV